MMSGKIIHTNTFKIRSTTLSRHPGRESPFPGCRPRPRFAPDDEQPRRLHMQGADLGYDVVPV